MCEKTACVECKYNEDLKGCVTKHVKAARKLLAEGKIEEVEAQLVSLETHLKEPSENKCAILDVNVPKA